MLTLCATAALGSAQATCSKTALQDSSIPSSAKLASPYQAHPVVHLYGYPLNCGSPFR